MIALLAFACNGVEDMYEGINRAPVITIYTDKAEGIEIADSVKVSGTVGFFEFHLGLKIEDVNNNIKEVSINKADDDKQMLFIQSDSILVDVRLVDHNTDKDSISLSVSVLDFGTHKIDFQIQDDFGRQSVGSLQLVAFENLPPVVESSYEISSVNPNSAQIDLSGSYDQDYQFGGEILIYTFLIEGNEITKTTPVLNHTFPGPGNYSITVYVSDNNGIQSTPEIFKIPIE